MTEVTARKTAPRPSGGLRAALNGSLRRQLIAWNIGTLAVLLGLMGVSVRVAVGLLLMAGIRRNLEANLSALPPPGLRASSERPPSSGPSGRPPLPPSRGGPSFNDSGPPGFGSDRDEGRGPRENGERTRRLSEGDTNIYAARRFDLQGKPFGVRVLLDAQGFARAKTGQDIFSRVVVDGVPLQVLTVPFRQRGRIVAVGQAAYPIGETERTLADLTTALLLLIPLGLLGAGIGGALLTTRVLRRVGQTARAAEQITIETSGNVSARLPVMGNDEFAELAQAFNDLLGRLELASQKQAHLLDQQRRFTADASHELKTPLTVIRGAATLLLGESGQTATSADYQKVLQKIDHASRHMDDLVGDLLLLARSDSAQLAKQQTELLVADVLAQARTLASPSDGIGAPIKIVCDDPALSFYGSEAELMRVFANLFDNAVRHTPPSGQITATAWRDRESVVVTITDTGEGITADHLPYLTERFYRVDASRTRQHNRGGTGLGLAIAKSIVEAHGGTLTITSQVGKGTTVTTRLPICK